MAGCVGELFGDEPEHQGSSEQIGSDERCELGTAGAPQQMIGDHHCSTEALGREVRRQVEHEGRSGVGPERVAGQVAVNDSIPRRQVRHAVLQGADHLPGLRAEVRKRPAQRGVHAPGPPVRPRRDRWAAGSGAAQRSGDNGVEGDHRVGIIGELDQPGNEPRRGPAVDHPPPVRGGHRLGDPDQRWVDRRRERLTPCRERRVERGLEHDPVREHRRLLAARQSLRRPLDAEGLGDRCRDHPSGPRTRSR